MSDRIGEPRLSLAPRRWLRELFLRQTEPNCERAPGFPIRPFAFGEILENRREEFAIGESAFGCKAKRPGEARLRSRSTYTRMTRIYL
jgi:hypothetical protein